MSCQGRTLTPEGHKGAAKITSVIVNHVLQIRREKYNNSDDQSVPMETGGKAEHEEDTSRLEVDPHGNVPDRKSPTDVRSTEIMKNNLL